MKMFNAAVLAMLALGPLAAPRAMADEARAPAQTATPDPAPPPTRTAAPPPSELRQRFDRELPALLKKTAVPSVSIARFEQGRLVFAAAYGEQSPGVAASTGTIYNIASMTKPLAAEVLLQLASEDRLSLDESMAGAWLDPDLAGDERAALLTPRLALSHRSGLPNWRYQTDGKLRFLHAPGETAGYSGEGYQYLARFAEKKTHQGFDTLMRERLFKPLGMADTGYREEPRLRDRYAQPTDQDGKPVPPDFSVPWNAADDLHATASDYARFMIDVARGDRLSPAIAQQRRQVQTDTRASACAGAKAAHCADAVGFGLGWEVLRFGQHDMLMHTGMDKGEFTLGYIDLSDRSGTVIFTNSAIGYRTVLPILDLLGKNPEFVAYLRSQAGQ